VDLIASNTAVEANQKTEFWISRSVLNPDLQIWSMGRLA